VPVMAPVLALRFKPLGRDPATIDHVYGAVPPLAVSVAEYGMFTTPLGSDAVVITGFTVSVVVPDTPDIAAVIVVVPVDTPEASPPELIVATDVLMMSK
jgi:hypothetical protein